MEGAGITIGFWAMAGLTLSSAAMIIVVRNLLHAVLFLILSFVGVAGIYITLSADFVAVSQVLIYAGAIAGARLVSVIRAIGDSGIQCGRRAAGRQSHSRAPLRHS